MEWSILLMGPVGAGKTCAIRAVSDIEVVDTDVKASDETARLKPHTTVAMDVGVLDLGGGDKLRLCGAPGQDRFDFMWDILLAQSRGIVLLLKHDNPDPVADLEHFMDAVESRLGARRLPLVIGVTHTDRQPRRRMAAYGEQLQRRGSRIWEIQPPVLEVDARNADHVRAMLLAVGAMLEMAARFPRTGQRVVAR